MSGESESQSKRRRYGCIGIAVVVLVLLIGVPWAWSTIQQAQWDANSGTQTVEVKGALWGDGYEIADTATIESWAEHEETAVYLQISRTSDTLSRTPIVALEIENESYPIRCETSRAWMWSTDAGSEVTLLCDLYLNLDRLHKVEAVAVDLSAD